MDSTRTRMISIGLLLLLVVGLPQAFAQNLVTFQVDMRMKMREGVFLPSSGDVVQVRSSFNGWGLGDTLSDTDNDSIFTKTLSLPIGPIEYKYFKTFRGGMDWEGSIFTPSGNRQDTVKESPQLLPVVYFDNDSLGVPPVIVNVTFRLNMGVYLRKGLFSRVTDTVFVRGGFNRQDFTRNLQGSDSIFSVTVPMFGNFVQQFKYWINSTNAPHGGWESWVGPDPTYGNRVLNLFSHDTTLPVVYFNNLSTVEGSITEVEPNNTASQANSISYGDTVNGTLSPSGDVDYFQFYATAGDTLDIQATMFDNSMPYSELRLTDENGNYLGDSNYYGPSEFQQRIIVVMNSTGIRYIRYAPQGPYVGFPNDARTAGEKQHFSPGFPLSTSGSLSKVGSQWVPSSLSSTLSAQPLKFDSGLKTPQSTGGNYTITLRKFKNSQPVISWARWQFLRWNSAMLIAELSSMGLPTVVSFQYGLTSGYGTTASATGGPLTGLWQEDVTSDILNGLSPNTLYHFRVVATNSLGTSYGSDYTFRTPGQPQGWTFVNSPSNAALLGVHFAGHSIGAIVGWNGTVLRTTDAGYNWIAQSSGTNGPLFGVHLINARIGIVVGDNGTVLRTTDGGSTWGSVNLGSTATLYGIDFVDTVTGTIVGSGGYIFRTTDGGSSWVQQSSGTASRLMSVSFGDANTGIIVGESGLILRTINGGSTWSSQTVDANSSFNSVHMINGSLGMAVGNNYSYRTSDGGQTWTRVAVLSGGFTAIRFANPLEGYAAGYSFLMKTTDGGLTWNQINSGTSNGLYGIGFADPTHGIIVGDAGTILRTTSFLQVTSPNGGEVWRTGAAKTLKWLSGEIANLALDYTSDNGSSWHSIVASTPASAGSYPWTVPAIASTSCRVRVSDASAPSFFDTSDLSFTIVLTAPTTETEPNNTASQANYMEYGDSLAASIDPVGDVDYYRFIASAGDTIKISGGELSGSGLNGQIRLYNSNGNSFANNYFYGNQVAQPLISIIPSAGTYYIRLSVTDNNGQFPNSRSQALKNLIGGQGNPAERLITRFGGQYAASGQNAATSTVSAHSPNAWNNGAYYVKLGRFTASSPVIDWGGLQLNRWNSVVLSANVHPMGLPTTVSFQYGLTSSYGATAPATGSPVNGLFWQSANTDVIAGLTANTLYHFRVVATNSLGTGYSSDFTFTTHGQPQGWTFVTSPSNAALMGVHFASTSVGAIVGENGTILRTTDAGISWNTQSSGTNGSLFGVHLINARIGIAVGGNGTVLRTTDAGSTWGSVNMGSTASLYGIDFADTVNGTIVGSGGYVFRTSDGGSSWVQQSSGATSQLRSVSFGNSNIGVIVGDRGLILRSTNGGSTWSSQTVDTTVNLNSVHMVNGSLGVAVGSRSYRTSDGGQSWTSVPGLINYYSAVRFASSLEGYAASYSDLVKTTDGGLTWNQINSGTFNSLFAIGFADQTHGIIVGDYGTILRTTSFLQVTSPNGGEIWRAGAGKTITWLSGSIANAALDYTSDNGTSWHSIVASTPAAAGGYPWTVPAIASTSYRVRVSDASAPSFFDTSDSLFTIVLTAPTTETEPNNTAAQANYMEYGDSLAASIDPVGDVDYYRFIASAGDTIDISGGALSGSGLNGLIRLYDSNGNFFGSNYFYGNQVAQPMISIIPSAGTYYIRLSVTDNNGQFPNSRSQALKNLIGGQGNPAERLMARFGGQYAASGKNAATNTASANSPSAWNDGAYYIKLGRFTASSPVIDWGGLQLNRWNSVVLSANVNPMGLPTTVSFQYGLTSSYGATVPATGSPVNGLYGQSANTDVIAGLTANTLYHFRVVATNSLGTSYSNDFTFATPGQPQGWTFVNSPSGVTLMGVSFAGTSVGAIVGENGTILRSTDAGNSWNAQSSGTQTFLRGVHLINGRVGIAVGDNGNVVRTTDGGSTWGPVNIGLTMSLSGIDFADTVNGVAVGQGGLILRTTDGGSSWVKQSSSTNSYLASVSFGNANTGIIVGERGLILRTTNGGVTWSSQTVDTTAYFNSVHMVNGSLGVAAGYGVGYRTSDGGQTWAKVASLSFSIMAIRFASSLEGYAAGYFTLLKTTDGGLTWNQINSGSGNNLYAIGFADPTHGIIVGDYGTILRTTSFVQVTSPNGGEVWRAGAIKTLKWLSGSIANAALDYTSDNGTSWHSIVASTPAAAGSYSWTVPAIASTSCRIRVSDASTPSSFDVSDSSFTIVLTAPTTETEPNNTAAQANYIDFDDSLAASIDPVGDVDYYRFIASAGDTIDISGGELSGSGLNGQVQLYKNDGSYPGNTNYYNTQTTQHVVAVIQSTGTYYIRYSATDNNGGFPNSRSQAHRNLIGGQGNAAEKVIAKRTGQFATLGQSTASHPLSTKSTSDWNNGPYWIKLSRFQSSAPSVVWTSWFDMNWDSFRMSGGVLPNGPTTAVSFDYGPTDSYGGTIAALQSPVSGLNQYYVYTDAVTGLSPNAIYHFRQHVTNSMGTALGDDNFTTTPAKPTSWTIQQGHKDYILNDISFVDHTHGLAVGNLGTVLQTTDGGLTWVYKYAGGSYYLSGIDYVTTGVAVAVAYEGNVLRTTDAGTTWAAVYTGSTSLYAVTFGDPTHGIVTGDAGMMLRTTDAGVTWNSISSGTTNSLAGVSFSDVNNGLAVGALGTILQTTDAGLTWTPKSSGSTTYLHGVTRTSATVATAVGGNGLILRTTDGGGHWATQTPPVYEPLNSVLFTDENAGLIAGSNGTILRTTNGGLTWTSDISGTSNWLGRVVFPTASSGIIVGDYGTMLVSSAGPTRFSEGVSVRDNCSGSGTLTFGLSSQATNGLDPLLGESELSALPPLAVFDARFILPVTPAISSLKDFRPDTGITASWRLTLQGCGYPFTFGWDSSALPAGSFMLRDELGGIVVNVDMKAQRSYTLTNPGVTSLQIVYSANICRNIIVGSGWNIVSTPVTAADSAVSSLYPGAVSSAFWYNNGYVQSTAFRPGRGYWLKFATADTFTICGQPVSLRDVPVHTGWNIIGPFETAASIAAIGSTPTGIVTSNYFGYLNGYSSATSLSAGSGYWVKVTQDGALHLPAGSSKSSQPVIVVNPNWTRMDLTDNAGGGVSLYLGKGQDMTGTYELPPLPPPGVFDARFAGNKFAEAIGKDTHEIQIASGSVPVSLTVSNLQGRKLRLKDAVDGKQVNAVLVEGRAVLIPSGVTRINIEEMQNLPTVYELSQNYPNPFNPTTIIKFALPAASYVTLEVINTLGQRVVTLVDGYWDAGYHQVEFNALNIASGSYFYRIKAGTFVSVKKLVLLK